MEEALLGVSSETKQPSSFSITGAYSEANL